MTDAIEFVEEFLQHEYDPVKAREYYLRTRKLKGRQPGKAVIKTPAAPGSKKAYNGEPLPVGNKRMHEDQTPLTSPGGNGKLVDYDGGGNGKATYADGWVYEPATGWKKGGQAAVNSAQATNNSQRAKSGLPAKKAPVVPGAKTKMNPRRRIGAAEQKLIRAKTLAAKVKDPKKRAALQKQLSSTEKKLKAAQAKHSPMRKGLRA